MFPHLRGDLNPKPPADEASALTIILTLQVIIKGVKVCAEQNMSNHLPGGNLN